MIAAKLARIEQTELVKKYATELEAKVSDHIFNKTNSNGPETVDIYGLNQGLYIASSASPGHLR